MGLFRGNTDSSFTLESLGGEVTPQTSTFYLHSSSSISKLTWSPVLCNFLLERGGAEESGLILVLSLKSHSPKVRDIFISLFRVGRETPSSRKRPQIWSPFPTSKLISTFYLCKGRFQIVHCALYPKKVLTNLKLAPSLKCVYLTPSMKHHINNTANFPIYTCLCRDKCVC